MLVLTRKTNEVIVIGDDIEVTVLESKDGRVQLGVTAPRQVTILRSECLTRPRKPVADLIPEAP
jgi:carbon storage regulator